MTLWIFLLAVTLSALTWPRDMVHSCLGRTGGGKYTSWDYPKSAFHCTFFSCCNSNHALKVQINE